MEGPTGSFSLRGSGEAVKDSRVMVNSGWAQAFGERKLRLWVVPNTKGQGKRGKEEHKGAAGLFSIL